MKKPKLFSLFSSDELEIILTSIYYTQKFGDSQDQNLQLCFVTQRIEKSQGQSEVNCKKCQCGSL